ncbi:MAG: D-glycero-alpha-D-manno-heptose-1,7-bisphosphate 7-phosphatase [Candidatus Velamenicoccus archaeovorus]
MSRRFVLLDRDGTVNEEGDYVLEPSQLRLLPGAAAAVRRMRELGLGVVVVTNQSPVGRGWITAEGLDAIHARLLDLLAEHGATVDGIYTCPHAPDEGCDCRKPATGLVRRAAAEHRFDPGSSFLVGDHASDMRLGRAVGATTILVLTGHGREELARGADREADAVVADLTEAATVITHLVADGAAT